MTHGAKLSSDSLPKTPAPHSITRSQATASTFFTAATKTKACGSCREAEWGLARKQPPRPAGGERRRPVEKEHEPTATGKITDTRSCPERGRRQTREPTA